MNPVSLWRGAPAAAERNAAAGAVRAFAGCVKVVHNDLSDADVEVVPVKSRTAAEAAMPELPPPTRPWEFLAERMFHATVD